MDLCRKKGRRTLGNSKRVHLALIITFCNLRLKDKIQNCFSSNSTIGNIKCIFVRKGFSKHESTFNFLHTNKRCIQQVSIIFKFEYQSTLFFYSYTIFEFVFVLDISCNGRFIEMHSNINLHFLYYVWRPFSIKTLEWTLKSNGLYK